MLQQTRVEVVRDYYRRWMERFPTLERLAASQEEDVLRLWQGLGYYSRAKRLRAGAQYVSEKLAGALPETPDELVRIPGIGPYSAGAISSIAFGRPSPLVDGNVVRVLCRLFLLEGDPNKAPLKKHLWTLAGLMVPREDPSTFNQALMELGALVCTPKSPACHACPLRRSCAAHSAGRAVEFPQLPPRKKPTELEMAVAIFTSRGRIGIIKLPAEARWWAGLDALPFTELAGDADPAAAARKLARQLGVDEFELQVLPPMKHTVTRFKITLTPVLVRHSGPARSTDDFRWVAKKGLPDLALPAPHRKALDLALG